MSRDGYLFYSSESEALANYLFGCWKCVAGVLFALHEGVLTAQARVAGPPRGRAGGYYAVANILTQNIGDATWWSHVITR